MNDIRTVDASKEKPEGLVRVLVSIPKWGYTFPEAYLNRLVNFAALGKLEKRGELLKENPRFEFLIAVIGDLFTPLAREESAKMAIESNSDYLFMIDDDMICSDHLFDNLYKHDVDIVAPLAFTRNPPHHPVLYQCLEGYDPAAKKDWTKNVPIFKYPRNKLVEVDAVGFGAVLIKRKVLEGIPGPRFMSTCGTGEDIYFCYQAKKHGFRVFSDTATKIGHLGAVRNITEDYVDVYRDEHQKEQMIRTPDYCKYPIMVNGK